MLYRLVDPTGTIARNTMQRLDALWNPCGEGGYARYALESDPDSPGAWPFATCFIAGAALEGGMQEVAIRAIRWLVERAGAGGSWLEFYGYPRSEGQPPVGIVAWAWAQYLILVLEGMLGLRIFDREIRIAPRIDRLRVSFTLGGETLQVITNGFGRLFLDDQPVNGEEVRLSLPLHRDHVIRTAPAESEP